MKESGTEDLPTGPAADIEDLQQLLMLSKQAGWEALERHLRKIWQSADNRLMKFNTAQVDGYWKGVKAIAMDLLLLPKNLNKQLEGISESKGGKGDEEE